jgi:hypothetical protein
MKKITIIILILLGAISCDKEKMNKDVQQDTNNDLKIDNKEKSAVFEKIGSLHSGIDFSNNLEDKLDTYENLFDFDFFYNGSGVGIKTDCMSIREICNSRILPKRQMSTQTNNGQTVLPLLT